MVRSNTISPALLLLTGFCGILATLGVGTGEFLMHFSASGGNHEVEFGFLSDVPFWQTQWGHFLAVLSAPLYIIGYYHIYHMLKPAGGKLPLIVLLVGAYGFAVGAVWIGSRALLTLLIQHKLSSTGGDVATFEQLLHHYSFFSESLLQVVRMTTLVSSGLIFYLILTGKTHYPRKAALVNPFFVLVLVFLTFFFLPAIGKYLIPTAMNIAHFVFFTTSILIAKRVS